MALFKFRHNLTWLLLALSGIAMAQTTVTFWHSMGGAEEAITDLAAPFNASQNEYVIDAQYVVGHPEAQTRLVATFGTTGAPAQYQAGVGYRTRAVADGGTHVPSECVDGL